LAASTYYYNTAKENKKENKDDKTPTKKADWAQNTGIFTEQKRRKISDEQN